MGLRGRVTPGLSEVICEAFQVLIVPSKMPARVGASSLSPLGDAGQVVGDDDPAEDVGDLDAPGPRRPAPWPGRRATWGRRRRRSSTVSGLELLMPAPLPNAGVVDLHALVLAGVGVEGLGEEGLDEGRAGRLEGAGRCLQIGLEEGGVRRAEGAPGGAVVVAGVDDELHAASTTPPVSRPAIMSRLVRRCGPVAARGVVPESVRESTGLLTSIRCLLPLRAGLFARPNSGRIGRPDETVPIGSERSANLW